MSFDHIEEAKVYPRVSIIILNCNGWRESKYSAKAVHISHCVDTKMFKPRSAKSNNAKVRVLFVGQIAWHKGVDLLLDIIKDELWENVEYWFVGKGSLSEELLGLANRGYLIEYFGYVSNRNRLARIYENADILVLPSRRTENWEEFFGIVLIEAMASGLPVIATDCTLRREEPWAKQGGEMQLLNTI